MLTKQQFVPTLYLRDRYCISLCCANKGPEEESNYMIHPNCTVSQCSPRVTADPFDLSAAKLDDLLSQ